MGRQFIFKNYWSIAPLGAAVGIALVVIFRTGQAASLVASIIAVALGFCYFAQRQKLAEASLFKELFTEFNHRFDDMNGPLREIAGSSKPPDQSARETIINYINLCSEEYLFFKEGYIHREVWRAWCAGMLLYLEREPFRSAWEDEERTGSYYGLCVDVIRGGAA